ncbi:hypothetical protein B9Z55_025780 [Caenorhabditis nigoni]|uniref:Uncharacterized protein n=1 Tax=Caenorhabditis nigoni TaxID=1611254 RepID=A0A2G5T0B2_9PELO|nr:hypothetical protein B9Z55_025780 [Caenorhabditis nigoni]
MSEHPEDAENNHENDISRFLMKKHCKKDYGLFPLDQEEREEIFSDMRALDVLGRNYRNVVRAEISDFILTNRGPPRLVYYFDDVPMEELIQFIHTQEEDDQWVRRLLTNLSDSLWSVEEHLSSRNNRIQSYQQWDIKNWQDCYKNILKDVFYLYEKHGEMFVRALNQFLTPLHIAFIDEDLFNEPDVDTIESYNDYIAQRDEVQNPYDIEKLFSHCLHLVLESHTSKDCGYFLQVLAPWLEGAKKALRNSRADFNLYDRERMRIQRKQRLAKFKIEKENGFFVRKYVVEDQRVSMQTDGVKSEISMEKKKAKKRKLVIDVTKSKKKQEMASTTIETSSPFHRSTPFPSNGGFSQYLLRIQKTTIEQ